MDKPCPVCGNPRKRGANRNLLVTCGSPECVETMKGQRAGEQVKRKNWRPPPGWHACGDANSRAEGSNGHYACGGKGTKHRCVSHGIGCDKPYPSVWPADDEPMPEHGAGPVCVEFDCPAIQLPNHRHPLIDAAPDPVHVER